VFRAHPEHEKVTARLCELSFAFGYSKYDRYGLIVEGEFGEAEASPLIGYFDDVALCISGAIESVTKPHPEQVRQEIEINAHLSHVPKDIHASTIKLKVSELGDAERVRQLREKSGPTKNLRIDANGSFTRDEALRFCEQIKDLNIEFFEQPCMTNSECAQVRASTDIAIAIDETARRAEQIDEIIALQAADLLVVKVQPCGGIHQAYERALQWNGDVVVSSMMEGFVGLDVGMKLARSVPRIFGACGLDSSTINDVIVKPFDE
jgi:O-succinylbenzoate synthase